MKIHQILINSDNTIPKLPDYIQFCQSQIKKLYPGVEYHLYSGEELECILKNNFPKDIIKSYHSFQPYAYKADLARYCILYLYGGLYIDLSLLCLSPLTLKETDFFAFRDLPEYSDPWWAINNAIIYTKPRSNIMKTAINIIVHHCKTQFYGTSAIDVGGPTVLGKAVMRSDEDFNRVFTNGQVNYVNVDDLNVKIETLLSFGYDINKLTGFVLDKNKEVITLRKPSKGGDIQSIGLEGTNNYVEMWLDKNIYKHSIKFNSKLKYM